MSAKRTRSAVNPSDRSIHPNIAGAPWWVALLTAVGLTSIGYAIDAGNKGLTNVFAGFYIAGCLIAVLAVRRKDLFTAVIQPPLILFCAVPGAYWLFHGGKVGHLKDLLINCGYPLIERFPLMLGAAGAVLLIGLIRWYLDAPHRAEAAAADDAADAKPHANHAKSLAGVITGKLNALLGIDSSRHDRDKATASAGARPRATTRKPASNTATRNRRSATRSRADRRPVERELVERARRRRQPAARNADAADPADPARRSRRQPRPQQHENPRDQRARRNPYERPAAYHGGRLDGSEYLFSDLYAADYPPPRPAQHDKARHEKPERVYRHAPNQPHAPYQPHGQYGGPNANPSHHPIAHVRYRGSARTEEPER